MSESQPAPQLIPHPQSELEDDPDDDLDSSDAGGGDPQMASANAPPVRSIYMSEKSAKGRPAVRQPRKDKGKTRMTAYMLWARSIRNQIKDDDLDFAARSRRIAEMWTNVPNSERVQWRRRVKTYNKQVAKQQAKEAVKAQAALKPPPATAGITATTATTSQMSNRQFLNKSSRGSANAQRRSNETGRMRNGKKMMMTQDIVPAALPESTDPTNVAAHLKLLGDCLSNIGESLEQHEGRQNSITGTVSVLLDSLLCSVVPLICLSTQIEGFGDRVAHLKDTFQDTLDNIAYVMPGLPF